MKATNSPANAASKCVGIWIRVSTEDQARGESPELHERRARYYAESKGWEVKDVYHLEGVSGKSVSQHSEAQRMLDHIRSGHISGLIFSKLARLARNTKELLEFADLFRDCGADLISLQESIDTSTPAGRLFYTIIAAMAQWEREETVERVKASIAIRAKLGKCLGGPAPFGYRWVDKKLVPESKEAPVRKLIYELFAEHKRKKTVTRVLNDGGYRTRNGSQFTAKTVDRLLRDPTAKGVHRGNYTTRGSPTENWSLKPESEWVFTDVEAIVSEELWNQCNTMLADMDQKKRPVAKKPVHLFAGCVVCECGEKMYAPSNTPKYVCRKCRNKIAILDLEHLFMEQLRNFFFSNDGVQDHIAEADKGLAEKEKLLHLQQKELEKLLKELDTLYSLLTEGHITKDGFGRRNRLLEDRQKQLEESIPRLQAEIDISRINQLSTDEIIAEAKDLYSHWPQLEPAEKREIVEAITNKIVVGKNELVLDLCYLPPGKDMANGWRKGRVMRPFCHIELSALRKDSSEFFAVWQALGTLIREKRMEITLSAVQCAEALSVSRKTLNNWENGSTKPDRALLPNIVRFIGFDPFAPNSKLRAATDA